MAEEYKRAAADDPDEVSRIFGVYGGALAHWKVFTPDNMTRVLTRLRMPASLEAVRTVVRSLVRITTPRLAVDGLGSSAVQEEK